MTAAVAIQATPYPLPAAGLGSVAADLLHWRQGTWWGVHDGAWVQLAVDRSLRWSDPVQPSAAEASDANAELAATQGRPVARMSDIGVSLYTLENRGALVVRRHSWTSGQALPPPPVPYILESHGAAGVSNQDRIRRSVQIVAAQIAADCRRFEVIAWARGAIAEANLPDPRGVINPRAQVAALFEALKRRTVFVRDPVNTEAIASTVAILCLDPGGVCLRGGDCDDMIVALGASCIAIGIPVRLSTRTYAGKAQGHIVLQFDASNRGASQWECIDPQYESGACSTKPYLSEIITEIDLGNAGEPMFVGIGLDGSGATLGDGGALGDTPAASLSADESAGWVELLASVKDSLDRAAARLRRNAAAYDAVRADLGFPPNDPPAGGGGGAGGAGEVGVTAAPLSAYVRSVTSGAPAWTASAWAAENKLLATADYVSRALADGLNGTRALSFDGHDLFVAAQPGDPFGVMLVRDPSTGAVTLQYVDASGQSTGTLGLAPILIGIGLLAAAVVSAAAAYAVAKYCDYLATAHHDDAMGKIADNQAELIQSGKASPQQVADLTKAQTELAKATQPPPQTTTDFSSVARWIGIGVVAVAAALGLLAVARVVEAVAPPRRALPARGSPVLLGDPRARYVPRRRAKLAAGARAGRRAGAPPWMVQG